VRALPGEAQETRITDAIMALSRTLGVRLIAEGIESREQLEYLRAAQCEEGQGYLFSRPLAADELTSLLAAGRVAAMREGGPQRSASCSLITAVRNATAVGDTTEP
jgi:EAL domain-containing protein (putative c-di-GMP-specific phosphodiesterase class I)